MTIRFADSVPVASRRWIRATIKAWSAAFGFEAWEYEVSAKRFRWPQLAAMTAEVRPGGSMVTITLHPDRLGDRAHARADLLHELAHMLDMRVQDIIEDLAAHIPDEKQRRRAYRRAHRQYEVWHDMMARAIGALL